MIQGKRHGDAGTAAGKDQTCDKIELLSVNFQEVREGRGECSLSRNGHGMDES